MNLNFIQMNTEELYSKKGIEEENTEMKNDVFPKIAFLHDILLNIVNNLFFIPCYYFFFKLIDYLPFD